MNSTNGRRSFIVSLSTIFLFIIFLSHSSKIYSQADWKEVESEHFKIVFIEEHSHLVPKIMASAENALQQLMKIFDYEPSEKIVICTFDIYDFGFGSATSVPQNFIRLEIEPIEPSYEIVPYYDRLQWILSHELVHIIVNDQESDIEAVARSIFSKVQPEKMEPLTIFYSLLTNYNRYSPRWHQEAIAVFMETWLSGGFGRIFSNFNEMYFRTMVLDSLGFPNWHKIESITSHNSFLLETVFYLFGTRFTTYLTSKYDVNEFIDWFKQNPDDCYSSFYTKFEEIYGLDFNQAWDDFIKSEIDFQKENISKLSKYNYTPIDRLTNEPFGWVSQPYYSAKDSSVLFAYHRSHELGTIQKFDLNSSQSNFLETLPSPSMHQVASTAYDSTFGYFFYTTNNNMLFRDLWVLDTKTEESKLLFPNKRIGHLTVSPVIHDLWGIQHSRGVATLVFSAFPYSDLYEVVGFNVGDEIYQLSVSPSGKTLAAVLHRANGEQEVVLTDVDRLKRGGGFSIQTLTGNGSPENISWSGGEKYIYWNAYVNGVANIYRINLDTKVIEPLSHTPRGLFKPIEISRDSLFAFEFSTNGFKPVVIPIKVAENLPAIEYLGQRVIEKNPIVTSWLLNPVDLSNVKMPPVKEYNGLANMDLISIVPVLTGFQKQKVIGIFAHMSDPLIDHDLTLEFGYSPFNEQHVGPRWHFKLKYDYHKKYLFGIEHNAPDFYDLFNQRKRGMIGTKIKIGNLHYWVYDNPLKVQQATEIALYTGVEFINDNLVRVSRPDFLVAQTELTSKYLRRTIGSSDFEAGDQFIFTLRTFGSNPDNPNWAGQFTAEWDNFSNLMFKHNTLHLKLAAGYHYDNEEVRQARFYFGGFGNREVEDVDVKQFRKLFRFPGIPMYSLDATKFVKVMLENNLPPLRFADAVIGQHFLNHIDASIYTQALVVKSPQSSYWVDLGGQINFVIKHWYNLESTFSAGIAKAWWDGGHSWEGFLSIKLLKN